MKPSLGSFLTISQVAKMLGVTTKTVREWCQTGKLPAIPKAYGHKTSYMVSPQAVEMLLAQPGETKESQSITKCNQIKHAELIPLWVQSMTKGFINGQPFSPRTVDDYRHYVALYFQKHQSVTVKGLQTELGKIPVQQVSKRQHYYKAIVCLGKFLIKENALDESFLKEAKPLFPKRHLPPKRHSITEEQLKALLVCAETEMERLLLILLATTGLRASECCALALQDIELDSRTLIVRLGKGNKTRKLGLSTDTVAAFQSYLMVRAPKIKTENIFLDNKGKPLHRHGLYQRLERIGINAGVKVSPHALRRAFVTINANKGRPLQMLQMACGHSDIKTTMSYCRTTEQEVIAAMRDWN